VQTLKDDPTVLTVSGKTELEAGKVHEFRIVKVWQILQYFVGVSD
jgi:hypothetical protein